MQKNSWLVILLFLFSLSASAQYKAVGDTLIYLPGYQVPLTSMGFPQQVSSIVTGDTAMMLLAENIHFHLVRQSDGKDIRLKAGGVSFTKKTPDSLAWQASGEAPEVRMEVSASLGARGIIEYGVKITALEDLDLKDIVMHIPYEKSAAKYVLGLGLTGYYNPDTIYHWKPEKSEIYDKARAWIGSTIIGAAFYLSSWSSWSNEGKGGIDVGNKGKSMLVHNYSGLRHLKKDDSLDYDFYLIIRAIPADAPINTDH